MHACLSTRPLVGALTLIAIAGAAAAARAQTPAPGPLPPATRLDPYVVQGRAADLVGAATTASQGSVGAKELEARPWLRRGELLEVIPGVVITQHSGGGKANQYFLRGFNLDHGTDFAVSVDGQPVNLRSHAHGQGYADLNFVIPETVRQVDYTKGPFHTATGDFASAGAAEFRLFDVLPGGFAKLELGANAFVRLAAGASRTDGAWTAGGAGSATTGVVELGHDDGPWTRREDATRLNGFARHAWRRAAGEYRLTAMAYRGDWNATDQIPERAVADGRLGRFDAVDPTAGGASERASLAFDATWRTAEATTRLHAHAVHYRLNLFSNFTYFLDDAVNGDQFNQRDRRQVWGGALTRTWTDGAGRGPASETTAGVQVRADLIGELGLHRTTARRRHATVRDDDVKEASTGVFVQRTTRWSDTLRTEAGLRYDGFGFDVTSDTARNSGRRTAGRASPKLGAAFGPWAKTELYANAGFGFHSNDARGTTIRVDPADGTTPVERVTPLARSRGVELGLRTTAVPGLVSTLAVWGLDLDSELVFVGDAGGTEATGRTRRHGVDWANYWRAGRTLVFDADFAATHARYRDDAGTGTRIANSIATVVTAGATAGGETGWFGSARLRFFGPQPLTEDNAVRAPATTTVNGRIGWRTRTWEAAVDVLNVFDRANHDIAYFYASRLPGEAAGGSDDVHFHPAEPRTVRVSVTAKF